MALVNMLGDVALDATLQQVRDRLPADGVQPVSVVSSDFLRVAFAEVGSGLVGKAAEHFVIKKTGSGMTVNQTGGRLVITSGITGNSETVLRSINPVSGSLLARLKLILSQRIINQTFRVEMADVIGENLAYVINSTTSVTVTFPTGTNPFTAINIGQSLRLSILSSVGTPGRFAISGVSGDTVTFTVSAWPASGSGTLTLYGWNWIAVEYTGTTATSASFDAQRRGWASGLTTITTNTSASPGHVLQLINDVHTAGVSDALVASNTGFQWISRGSRIENIPDPDVNLYVFITVLNGNVPPASSTTMTIGFFQVEDLGRQKVRIASSDPSPQHAQPVQVLNPTSTSVTAAIGTTGLTVYTDSSTNLTASGVFTGTARDGGSGPAFNKFVANVWADQAGVLQIQKSTDNVTWRTSHTANVTANQPVELLALVTTRYYRVVYTNGGVAQTQFLLTSAYHKI